MKWRKLGRLYAPDGSMPWARAHAMLPTVLTLGDGRLRIYMASTDENTVGRVGYLDVAADDPTRVLAVAPEPVLGIGEPGCFDDNGVNPCCLVEHEGRLLLYYVGYQLHRKVPYTLFTGLAESKDGGASFHRVSRAPILDRNDRELFFRTAPFVRREGGRWRMWYIGGGGWLTVDGQTKPTYSLCHADSEDGVIWSREGQVCLEPRGDLDEFGFGRPVVLHEGGRYRLFYSIRSASGYRMGYAESPDGLQWERRDAEVGIGLGSQGDWDGEMICYGVVQDTPAGRFLFYNGNQYGRSGVGVAVLDAP